MKYSFTRLSLNIHSTDGFSDYIHRMKTYFKINWNCSFMNHERNKVQKSFQNCSIVWAKDHKRGVLKPFLGTVIRINLNEGHERALDRLILIRSSTNILPLSGTIPSEQKLLIFGTFIFWKKHINRFARSIYFEFFF